MFRKHLKTLELENVDLAKADITDIRAKAKKAYRKLMLKNHSDRTLEKDADPSTAKTALLNAANEFLINSNTAITEIENELEAKKMNIIYF